MSAKILDGKALAAKLKEELAGEARYLKSKTGNEPVLCAVSLLDDPAIDSYALTQKKAAEGVGFDYKRFYYPAKSEEDALDFLNALLVDHPHAALFIFKPVPPHIDFNAINTRLTNVRIIEGVYPYNLGFFFLGMPCLVPPTPAAVLALLQSSGVPLEGKHAVILGRSEIVGKPLLHLLLRENLTVTVCHSKTPQKQMIALTQQADVVIACIGKAEFVKKEWIKKDAIVIDVGTSVFDGKNIGDVAHDVKDVAGFVSPVPGGVGPVTSVMLMRNVLEVFKQSL